MTASVGAVGAHPAAAGTVAEPGADHVTVTVVKTATATKTATKAGAEESAKTAARNAAAKKRTKKHTAKRKISKASLQRAKARRAVKAAEKQIGDPYRYGATGPGAFDCSGLVQYAWRKAGVRLPRTTWSIRSAVRKEEGVLGALPAR
ncbi:NlpC/P60 family protein [Microbispora hainanensis]|uniref:C40 family peptidase n=1 Tax=Microbispora hainanensis TaxID=568844 RepID=UPI0033F99131